MQMHWQRLRQDWLKIPRVFSFWLAWSRPPWNLPCEVSTGRFSQGWWSAAEVLRGGSFSPWVTLSASEVGGNLEAWRERFQDLASLLSQQVLRKEAEVGGGTKTYSSDSVGQLDGDTQLERCWRWIKLVLLCSSSSDVLACLSFFLVSVQTEVCTTVALVLLLLGTTSYSALVLGHWEQGVLNALSQCLPRRARQQLFHGTNVSQNIAFQKAKKAALLIHLYSGRVLKSHGPWSHISCTAFCLSLIMSPFPGFSYLEEGGSLLFALCLLQALCCNVLMVFPRREHGNSHPQQTLLGAPGLRGQEVLKWKNIPVGVSFFTVFFSIL